MTHETRIVLLFGLLLCFQASVFAVVNRLVFDATNTDGEGLAVDSTGAVIHMLRSSNTNQFFISKTDADGNLVTGFGSNGVVTLTTDSANSAASYPTVRALGYYRIDRGSNSYISIDTHDRILLAVKLLDNFDNGVLAIIRLNSENGQFDTSYDSDGVAVTFTLMHLFLLKGLAVDSSDRAILALHHTSGGIIGALRFSSAGVPSMNATTVSLSLDGDLSITTDSADNIYLAGRSGVYAFCTKLLASYVTLDTTFATNGKYSANMSTDENSAVFVAVSSGTIYLLSLNIDDINFNITELSSAGAANVTHAGNFPNPVVLKNAFRRSDGKYYIGGTIDSSGQTAFWSRFTASGGIVTGDTTFANVGSAHYIANGIAKVPVTVGATVASGAGGILGYNSTTNTVAVGFKETLSGVTRFVRDFGTEAGSFLTAPETVITPSVVTGSAPVRPVNGGRRDAAFNRNTVTGSNVTSINDAGITVTAYDDVVAYLRSGDNFILSKINEQGSLETDFGSGARLIKIRSTEGSTSTAAIANLSEVISGKPAYITHDLNKNILVAFQVNVAGGNPYFVIMRLHKDTGLLDTTFEISGFVVMSPGYAVCQVDGIAVNSAGKIVVLFYVDNAGIKFPMVSSFNNDGSIDFDTIFSANITNAVAGMTLKLDVDDNIFIAGKYGDASPYGLFCMKLNDRGTVDTNFRTGGKYTTGPLAEVTTTSPVFLSVYQFDDTESIQIITQSATNGGGVVLAQLSLLGVPDTVFSGIHTSFIQINNITTLNEADRNEDGDLFCGGTVTDGGVVKVFFSRITSKGLLDTTHGDLSGNTKTGTTLFTATSGTIQDGGWFSFDSGSAAAIMWIEQDGATRRLVIERVPAVDDLEFDPKILAAGVSADDLVGLELGYSLHADKLYRNLGIARHLLELRKSLDADPSVHLTTNVKSSAVTLFNQAIKSALTAKINRASNNSARSTHSMRHKKGAMNKEVAKLIYSTANFTADQQTALSTHISNRMNLIFDDLKNQRYKVTGKKAKTKKVPD